jgi:hypothetical protein
MWILSLFPGGSPSNGCQWPPRRWRCSSFGRFSGSTRRTERDRGTIKLLDELKACVPALGDVIFEEDNKMRRRSCGEADYFIAKMLHVCAAVLGLSVPKRLGN